MIGKNVKKISFGTAFALTTAFAAPAIAGGVPVAKQLHNNSATAEQWVKDLCPDKHGVAQCKNKIALVTYSDVKKDRAFATASFKAALRLHNEGLPVFYVIANDNDDDAQTASMMPYVNGKRYDGVTLSTKYGIISEGNARRLNAEHQIYAIGKDVYKKNELLSAHTLRETVE